MYVGLNSYWSQYVIQHILGRKGCTDWSAPIVPCLPVVSCRRHRRIPSASSDTYPNTLTWHFVYNNFKQKEVRSTHTSGWCLPADLRYKGSSRVAFHIAFKVVHSAVLEGVTHLSFRKSHFSVKPTRFFHGCLQKLAYTQRKCGSTSLVSSSAGPKTILFLHRNGVRLNARLFLHA